jgi:hypothetical protein
MDEEVIYLLNRFPKHKKLLMESYANNEEFRTLCREYYNSAITIEKYEHKVTKGTKTRQEYERAYSDLENSIARRLKSLKEARIGT